MVPDPELSIKLLSLSIEYFVTFCSALIKSFSCDSSQNIFVAPIDPNVKVFELDVYVPKKLLQSVVPESVPVAVRVTVKTVAFFGVVEELVVVVLTHVHFLPVKPLVSSVVDVDVVVLADTFVTISVVVLSVVVLTVVMVSGSCTISFGVVLARILFLSCSLRRTEVTLTPISNIAVTIRTLTIVLDVSIFI